MKPIAEMNQTMKFTLARPLYFGTPIFRGSPQGCGD